MKRKLIVSLVYVPNSRIGRIQLKHLIGGGGVPFWELEMQETKIPLPPVAIQNEIISKTGLLYKEVMSLRQNQIVYY